MSSVCIQVINPNTSLAMTETIGAAARAVAAPGTEILAVCPGAGVPSIEGHFDEAIAAVGVLEQVKAAAESRAWTVTSSPALAIRACWRRASWRTGRWSALPKPPCIWRRWWRRAFRWSPRCRAR